MSQQLPKAKIETVANPNQEWFKAINTELAAHLLAALSVGAAPGKTAGQQAAEVIILQLPCNALKTKKGIEVMKKSPQMHRRLHSAKLSSQIADRSAHRSSPPFCGCASFFSRNFAMNLLRSITSFNNRNAKGTSAQSAHESTPFLRSPSTHRKRWERQAFLKHAF